MRVPRWIWITAALWAAVFLCIWLMLPPATRVATPLADRPARVRGAFHVHTTRSDGGGTRADVARAAAAAGLHFVIITDHGDGTATPDAPEYLDGVLLLDGVEVTTTAGHYAAFGSRPSPYPLGGPPYAVVEDVERLGGFGVAAHPDSAKTDLRWRDWSAAVGGLEIINGDSAWRDEGLAALVHAVVSYPFRPDAVLAGMVERPAALLRRLDRTDRRLVALAGADAHARLPLTSDEEPSRAAWTMPVPSYETSFRAFVNIVDLASPFSGDAAQDAARLTEGIRRGRVVAGMTALSNPAELDFTATTGGEPVTHPMGAVVAAQPIIFNARTSETDGVRLTLLKNGAVVSTSDTTSLTHRVDDDAEAAGAWRIEASLANRPGIPWLLSNPIFVVSGGGSAGGRPFPAFPEEEQDLMTGTWAVERQADSRAVVAAGDEGVTFEYTLGGADTAHPYGAAVREVGGPSAWTHVVLRARASEPTRVWVQLRLTDSDSGQRWGRSIYLDRHSREFVLALNEFAPLEDGVSRRPNQATIRAVLFVVDTVNSRPGRSGRLSIERLAVQRHPVETR